jgi:hypothetical protein
MCFSKGEKTLKNVSLSFQKPVFIEIFCVLNWMVFSKGSKVIKFFTLSGGLPFLIRFNYRTTCEAVIYGEQLIFWLGGRNVCEGS